MNARDAMKWLDREGFLTVGDLRIGVRILNAHHSYGRLTVTVVPVVGGGSQRVDSHRIQLLPRGATAMQAIERGELATIR